MKSPTCNFNTMSYGNLNGIPAFEVRKPSRFLQPHIRIIPDSMKQSQPVYGKVVSRPMDLSQLAATLDQALQRPLVLVVDDDQELCANLRDLLHEQGYRVAISHDVRSATARLKDNGIGIVLIDFRLPDGSGRELLKTIRGEHADARTILITGNRSESLGDSLSDVRPDAVFYKPFDVKQLLELVEDFGR